MTGSHSLDLQPQLSRVTGWRLTVSCLVLLAFTALVPTALAQETGNNSPNPNSAALAGPADAAEAEAFFDGAMGAQMRQLRTVGATVSLVRGGELLFAKGYGYADLENNVLVDADRTVFPIASISKLFIWVAAMQLHEQGRLDLHTDISQYLNGVEVPATFDEPITMAHLMTHTAGFEYRLIGLFAWDETKIQPLADAVAQQMPARVRPPGDWPAYSNHGSALAALVVESVAGQPFREYVEQHILAPLAMRNTTLDQHRDGALAEQRAKLYRLTADSAEEGPKRFTTLPPAGFASATATDMGRFMSALLQDGALSGAQILQPETARTMRTPLITLDPAVNSLPYGFLDISSRGVKVLGHYGGGSEVSTMMAILPELDLGLFVAFNSSDSQEGLTPLLDAFLDRYVAPPARPPAPSPAFIERAVSFVGQYRENTLSHSTLFRINGLIGNEQVSVSDDGELLALGGRFVETAPRVFTERNGERSLVFIEGEDGQMSHFYEARFPNVTFGRVPSGEQRGRHLAIFVTALFAFLAAVLAWPLGWVVRNWFKVQSSSTPRIPWWSRLALWLTAALLLATVFGLLVTFFANPMNVIHGELAAVKTVLALPLLAAVPTLFVLWGAVRIWQRSQGTRLGRIGYTATTVLIVSFYWFLNVWNLLGIKV